MCGDTSRSSVPRSSRCVAKYLTACVNDPPCNLADYQGIPETDPSPEPARHGVTNRRTCHIRELMHTFHNEPRRALICHS